MNSTDTKILALLGVYSLTPILMRLPILSQYPAGTAVAALLMSLVGVAFLAGLSFLIFLIFLGFGWARIVGAVFAVLGLLLGVVWTLFGFAVGPMNALSGAISLVGAACLAFVTMFSSEIKEHLKAKRSA
jgi:hypothetical protein